MEPVVCGHETRTLQWGCRNAILCVGLTLAIFPQGGLTDVLALMGLSHLALVNMRLPLLLIFAEGCLALLAPTLRNEIALLGTNPSDFSARPGNPSGKNWR